MRTMYDIEEMIPALSLSWLHARSRCALHDLRSTLDKAQPWSIEHNDTSSICCSAFGRCCPEAGSLWSEVARSTPIASGPAG